MRTKISRTAARIIIESWYKQAGIEGSDLNRMVEDHFPGTHGDTFWLDLDQANIRFHCDSWYLSDNHKIFNPTHKNL